MEWVGGGGGGLQVGVLSVSASFSVLISLESHYSDESSVILLNLLSLRGLALARTHAHTPKHSHLVSVTGWLNCSWGEPRHTRTTDRRSVLITERRRQTGVTFNTPLHRQSLLAIFTPSVWEQTVPPVPRGALEDSHSLTNTSFRGVCSTLKQLRLTMKRKVIFNFAPLNRHVFCFFYWGVS